MRTKMTVTAPDLWWERLRNRDTPEGASFVYGVVTTGVYCRPGCPSRLPRKENVRFFTSGQEAKRAGFRPCLRCQPDGPSLEERQAETIAKACALIEAAEEKPDFDAVAKGVGMSRHHFHRVFKKTTGVTPGAYFNARRRTRVLDGLSPTSTVTEAIYGAGYSSASRFYETCAPQLGLKPSAFAKGGTGEVIRFAVGECSLGSILVAATAQGICAIQLGDTPEELVEALRDRFPRADLKGGDADFEQIVARVVGLVEEPKRAFDLPLHVRGTAFQQRVWEIPAQHSAGRDHDLCRGCRQGRLPGRGAGGCERLRQQQAGRRNPVPSRGAEGRRSFRLSMGCGTQGGASEA